MLVPALIFLAGCVPIAIGWDGPVAFGRQGLMLDGPWMLAVAHGIGVLVFCAS